MKVGTARRALGDAPHCGDLCAYWANGSTMTLCIVDGLGHGREAAEAAEAAISYVGGHLREPLVDIFSGCNRAIAATRGVAMAIAELDSHEGRLLYAGIGNTRGQVFGKKKTQLRSYYGIVGGGFRRLIAEELPYSPGDLIVLWSDGIPENIDVSRYCQNILADPEILAKQIVADHALGTDDAAAVVFLDRGGR